MLAVRPDDVRVLIDLGSAYDLKGDERQAQSLIERALVLEPGNPAALAALANVYHGCGDRLLEEGQFDRAIAAFDRAIETSPVVRITTSTLVGHTSQRASSHSPERRSTVPSRSIPRDIRTRVEIGGFYVGHGDEKDAQRLFRQALRLRPGPVTHLAIGLTYLRLEQLAPARRHFKHVLDANDPRMLRLLGKALNDARHELEAVRYLERAVALEPSDAQGHLDLAWSCAFGPVNYVRAAAEIAEVKRLALEAGDDDVLAAAEVASKGLAELHQSAPGAQLFHLPRKTSGDE